MPDFEAIAKQLYDALEDIYRVTPTAELQDERVEAAFDRAAAVLMRHLELFT